jgi:hypothetical protein
MWNPPIDGLSAAVALRPPNEIQSASFQLPCAKAGFANDSLSLNRV